MRIVSWNLHGAAVPGRATTRQQHHAWRYMRDELDADVILAQEVSSNGIPEDVCADWTVLAGEKGRCRKNWNWGSVIAAKPELGLRERTELYKDPWLYQLYDLVMVGSIDLGDGSRLSVASIHTAAMPVDDWLQQYVKVLTLSAEEMASIVRPGCRERPYINDFAFHALARLLRGERFFVAGDWNTCEKYAGGPNFFERAQASDWIRCHREEVATYFTKSGIGYQLDHAFSDPVTARRRTSAVVGASALTWELSDHAPIIVEFEV